MASLDKNKIFFGLIHYILSEQSNVDWILKTSLVNYTGTNSTIDDKKFQQTSLTNDIIEYIYQVKPYHVQFEQFIEKYSSDKDVANVSLIDKNDLSVQVRFDAVKAEPDINKIFYELIIDNELPEDDEYDKEGLEIVWYDGYDYKIYQRQLSTKDDSNEELNSIIKFEWIEKEEYLYDGIYYFSKNNQHQVFKNGVLKDEFDSETFVNAHLANRLWYYKYAEFKEIYNDDTKTLNYIKDILNGHFKGLTVDGYDFNIDKSGYDAFLYDSTLYDSNTSSIEYCLLDFSDNELEMDKIPYVKSFIEVGTKSIVLPDISGSNVDVIIKNKNGKTITDCEYSIQNNILRLSKSCNLFDKITIKVDKMDSFMAYVFVAHNFKEDDKSLDMKKIVDVTTKEFNIPFNQSIISGKLTVHKTDKEGNIRPNVNFTRNGNNIKFNENETFFENCRIIITTIDTKQLYDKIYTYEDCYGYSNNLISLDGDEFLRPYYEKDRPAELCVSYPINNLTIYSLSDNNSIELFNINNKNVQTKILLTSMMKTKLKKVLNKGDKEIYVENINKLILPKVDNGLVIPGKIIINSEIIEFYDCDEKNGILKSIRRAVNGSVLMEKHAKGSIIHAYNEQLSSVSYQQSIHSNIMIKNSNQKTYTIPGSSFNSNNISVKGKMFIELLSDITIGGKYFDISDDNVVLPTNNKDGYVFIDEDKVYFKNIEKITSGKNTFYRVSNYITDKEYKAFESKILSHKYRDISPDMYTINVLSEDTGLRGVITFNKALETGEIYTISNIK